MHIHLINLDRSTDRLAGFCDVNRHLTSVSRFPAVDGSTLEVDTLVSRGVATKDIRTMFSPGALGCAASHLALWDRAISNNCSITVCEDDAIFNHQFEPTAERLLQSLPADWDFVYWGFNFDMFASFEALPGVSPCTVVLDQKQMRAGTDAFQRLAIEPRLFKARWAFALCCYSISAKGAQTIKSKILPLKPQVISFPEAKGVPPYSPSWRVVGIDNAINAVHDQIKSYICFPPLVISKNEPGTSTILNTV